MGYILYVLLVVALHSDKDIGIYKPIMHTNKMECEYNKKQVLTSFKPSHIISLDVMCVKFELFIKKKKEEEEKGDLTWKLNLN